MNLVMQNWSLYYNQLIENDLGPDNLKKYVKPENTAFE